jgi:hypothetical protein
MLGCYISSLPISQIQYYLKTGTCKFGATCKYHHPRDQAGSTGRVQLNVLGLPLRPVCLFNFVAVVCLGYLLQCLGLTGSSECIFESCISLYLYTCPIGASELGTKLQRLNDLVLSASEKVDMHICRLNSCAM